MAGPRSPALLAVVLLAVAVAVTAQGAGVQLPCAVDSDCDTTGAQCVGGACGCPRGQVMTSDLTRCLPGAAEWGAECADPVQCVSRLLVGGSCTAEEVIASVLPTPATTKAAPAAPPRDVCQCAQGYHYLRGRCWRSAGLGAECRRDEDCYVNHDVEAASCQEGRCRCAPGFYQREYSSCRRVSTAYGDECGIVQDCQYEGSDCVNRLCACRGGYVYDKPTKKCVVHVTSEEHSRELARAAFKSLTARPARRRRSGVGDSAAAASECTSNADCGANSECESGACVCNRGYFKLAGEKSCHPEVLQACSRDADCTMKYAICRKSPGSRSGSLCSCRGGYIASADMRLCRKMSRALEWSCLHEEQCGYFGPGAKCDSKRCRCGPGTHWVQEQQYCWVSRLVGDTCQADEDCSALGQGASCTAAADGVLGAVREGQGGVCTCAAGYHQSAGRDACRPDAAGVGAACELDIDCVTNNTRCAAGACACAAGYMTDSGGKGCRPGVGGPCAQDADCGAPGSVCSGARCVCAGSTVGSTAGDVCLPVVTSINGTCSEEAQCGQLRALCTAGACSCGTDQHLRDGRCQPRRALGEACRATSECFLPDAPERSECRNGLCKCAFQFSVSGDGLLCSAGGRAALTAWLPLAAYLSLLWRWRGSR